MKTKKIDKLIKKYSQKETKNKIQPTDKCSKGYKDGDRN